MSNPRSITIYLLDGDPEGIRMAQISMSTIQALAFRRNQLKRVREAFPEIERPGVYLLIGDEDADNDKVQAYIGESEGIGSRLAVHNANDQKPEGKAFWTDTIALFSKDETLTKSHARYIEACLVRDAANNLRWSLPNTKLPSEDAGKLSLQDRAAMAEFVDQAKTLVGALGWDLFRQMRSKAGQENALNDFVAPGSPTFHLKGKGFAAVMNLSPSGEFVVRKGSIARRIEAGSLGPGPIRIRQSLLEEHILDSSDDGLVFTTDYRFSSPSTAAAVVSGMSSNGRTAWKMEDGTSYADWEASLSLT